MLHFNILYLWPKINKILPKGGCRFMSNGRLDPPPQEQSDVIIFEHKPPFSSQNLQTRRHTYLQSSAEINK